MTSSRNRVQLPAASRVGRILKLRWSGLARTPPATRLPPPPAKGPRSPESAAPRPPPPQQRLGPPENAVPGLPPPQRPRLPDSLLSGVHRAKQAPSPLLPVSPGRVPCQIVSGTDTCSNLPASSLRPDRRIPIQSSSSLARGNTMHH